METITAKLSTSADKLIAAHTDENGNATRSMRLCLAGHIDHVLVLTTHATGDEVELIIPRGGNVEEYINFAIDAAFVTHDETETETEPETETETTDDKEEETIMTTTTETTARTLTEEEAAAMAAAMADMRDEFGDDFDADSLETAAATEHKPRKTRKAYEIAAAKERRKQAEQKLCGRTSMLESERAEYANGKRPTHKTTREALLVYEEPGYEVSRGVHDPRQYFAHWARSEQRTDMSYLGRFSSDEAAIAYFHHWKRTHRAYIAA